MRQVHLRVPAEHAERVADAARRQDALLVTRLPDAAERAVVVVVMENDRIGPLLAELGDLAELDATFAPTGTLTVSPGSDAPPDRLVDVSLRSPLEVYLGGLQSLGGWPGLVTYAVVAGVVAWIGLTTDTSWLLVGAMLIAPFAGAAMHTALGVAAGDLAFLGRGLTRYAAALGLVAGTAAAMTLIFGPTGPSDTVLHVAQVSELTVLLPLVAGVAGASWLLQSERSSLVSGAAVGVLVSASLAPPSAVIGIALGLGLWEILPGAVFVVGTQLLGIHLAAALVFRLGGVRPGALPWVDASRSALPVATLSAAVALAALLALQLATPVALERSTLASDVREAAREAVRDGDDAEPVEVRARLPHERIAGRDTVLVEVVVQPRGDDDVEDAVRRRIQARLAAEYPALSPLVDVTALRPPDAPRSARAR